MKSLFKPISLSLFFVFLLVPLVSYSQEAEGSRINPDMSLTIVLERTVYFRLEPIQINSSFTNDTAIPQTTVIPNYTNNGILIVKSDDGKESSNQLSVVRVFGPSFPVTFQRSKGAEKEINFETRLDEIFPRAGIYELKLAVLGSEGKLIESNSVEITIREPEGSDKAAFEFIQKNKAHQQFPVLFTWNIHKKNEAGKTLLEEFVSKHGESVYGDYAILHLARYYRATKQFEKAKIELEKLKFSKNPRIAKEAKSVL